MHLVYEFYAGVTVDTQNNCICDMSNVQPKKKVQI